MDVSVRPEAAAVNAASYAATAIGRATTALLWGSEVPTPAGLQKRHEQNARPSCYATTLCAPSVRIGACVALHPRLACRIRQSRRRASRFRRLRAIRVPECQLSSAAGCERSGRAVAAAAHS